MAAVIRAQPGTLHYVTESDDRFGVAGLAGTAAVTAFGGDASWIGYALISGNWYGAGGAVVNTSFLRATGKRIGDTFTLTDDGRAVALQIAGEVFLPGNDPQVLTNLSSVTGLGPSGAGPQMFYVGLRPGVNAQSYQNAVFARLAPGALGEEHEALAPRENLLGPLERFTVSRLTPGVWSRRPEDLSR